MGQLIRVFDRVYDCRPAKVSEIVKEPVRFSTFVALHYAAKDGCFEVVGHADVPPHLKDFPIFRAAGLMDPKTNEVVDWWLWDGEKEWKIGALEPEQRKLPIRALATEAMLVHRIESGWRPETDMQ
jgi:hypothetical protein